MNHPPPPPPASHGAESESESESEPEPEEVQETPSVAEGGSRTPAAAAVGADTAAAVSRRRPASRPPSSPSQGLDTEDGTDAMVTHLSLESGSRPGPSSEEGLRTGEQNPTGQSAKRHKPSGGELKRDAAGTSAGAAAAAAAVVVAMAEGEGCGPVVGIDGQCAVCQQGATEEATLHWVVRSACKYLYPRP